MNDIMNDETTRVLRAIAKCCNDEPAPFKIGLVMPSTYRILNEIGNNVSDRYEVVQFAVAAMNHVVPLLDDRDRLKAEVATLEGLLADAASLDSTDTPRVWQLERRVRELEEALRPFAEWGDRLDHLWEGELLPDDRNLAVGHSNMRLPGDVSMSDLRRAAKVLEGRT